MCNCRLSKKHAHDACDQRPTRRRRRRERPNDCCCGLSFGSTIVLLLVTLASTFPSTLSAFVLRSPTTTARRSTRWHVNHSSSPSSWDDLTVKELRERVKNLSNAERGTLSRLKRKQDLIDYLKQEQKKQEPLNGVESPQRRRPSVTLQMPSLNVDSEADTSLELKVVNGAKPKGTNTTSHSTSQPTLKEAAFERVYERYPILRQTTGEPSLVQLQVESDATNDSATASCSYTDIRQWQHPIFHNNNISTDMDVVFVGTASCTPGVTRGVSCTALRLHWRRQTTLWNAQLGRMETPPAPGGTSTFQGGTWLFDVGECTQVRMLLLPELDDDGENDPPTSSSEV